MAAAKKAAGGKAARDSSSSRKAAGAQDSFTPTQRMASAARRGLRLREKFGRGGTEVGVRRAKQLADREALGAKDVRDMHSFFARHAVDKDAKAHEWNSDSDPSAGFIAWLLWGGDAGKTWAEAKAKKLDGAKKD